MTDKYMHLKDTNFPDINTVDVYKYQNNFDYSRWRGMPAIKLMNVKWNGNYSDVPKWDNDTLRDNWFDEKEGIIKPLETLFNVTPENTVRIPIPYNDAYNYNYLVVDMPIQTSKEQPIAYEDENIRIQRWYYFIDDMVQYSPNTTELKISLDYWTMFINTVDIPYLLLERGHAPMVQTTVDEFLQNPIENSEYLLADDFNFGDNTRIVKHTNYYPIGNGSKYVLFALPFNEMQFINLNPGEYVGPSTRATFSNTEHERWGYQYKVNGYEWNYGSQVNYNDCSLPVNPVNSNDGNLFNGSYVYAIKADEALGFFNKIRDKYAYVFNAMQACFMLADDMFARKGSFEFEGYIVYNCVKTTDVENIVLTKNDFEFDEKYSDITKLYTFPYSVLEITDDNGNTFELKVENTSGNMQMRNEINIAYPYLNYNILFTGINGNGSQEYIWSEISANKNKTIWEDDFSKFMLTWDIPTFSIFTSAEIDFNSNNWPKVQAERNGAIVDYMNAVRYADVGYENTEDSLDTQKTNTVATATTNRDNTKDAADVDKTNNDRQADTTKNVNDASALVAKENADLEATTDKTINDNQSNTNKTNNDATSDMNKTNNVATSATNKKNNDETSDMNKENADRTSNTNRTNADNTSNTNRTNADNTSNTNRTNADNTSNTNKINADNLANTNNTNNIDMSNANKINADRTSNVNKAIQDKLVDTDFANTRDMLETTALNTVADSGSEFHLAYLTKELNNDLITDETAANSTKLYNDYVADVNMSTAVFNAQVEAMMLTTAANITAGVATAAIGGVGAVAGASVTGASEIGAAIGAAATGANAIVSGATSGAANAIAITNNEAVYNASVEQARLKQVYARDLMDAIRDLRKDYNDKNYSNAIIQNGAIVRRTKKTSDDNNDRTKTNKQANNTALNNAETANNANTNKVEKDNYNRTKSTELTNNENTNNTELTNNENTNTAETDNNERTNVTETGNNERTNNAELDNNENTNTTEKDNYKRTYSTEFINYVRTNDVEKANNKRTNDMQLDNNQLQLETQLDINQATYDVTIDNNAEINDTNKANNADTRNLNYRNADRTFNTESANANRIYDTEENNADWNKESAIEAAKWNLGQKQIDIEATYKSANLSSPVVKTTTQGNVNPDLWERRGIRVNVRTQSKSAIAQTGDTMLRFGYALNRVWDMNDGFKYMKHFTYWKASDVWINDGSGTAGDAVNIIQAILMSGVTVWNNPDEIGGVSIYDNLEYANE